MQREIEITEEQQRIKGEVTKKVLFEIFETIKANLPIYDKSEQVIDAIFSIIVMVNRDVLIHLIRSTNNQIHAKRLLKEFTKAVTDEVNKYITPQMKN